MLGWIFNMMVISIKRELKVKINEDLVSGVERNKQIGREKFLKRKERKRIVYKQIIIARKDLNMSHGKLSAQVSHGSMAFLTNLIRNRQYIIPVSRGSLKEWGESSAEDDGEIVGCDFEYIFDKDLYEQWIDGEFTKCVLQAKNKNQLLKAKTMAEKMGMKEGKDFWLIRDNCHTELKPEEDGRTLTVIGFRPFDETIIDKIGKKYHLYTD